MKKLTTQCPGLLLVFFIFLFSCEDNKDPAPADCSQTTLQVNVDGSTPVTGCGGTDGSLTVSAQGGQGEIQFSLDSVNFQNSGIFTGLEAGNYTVTARDENQCHVATNASVAVEGSDVAIASVTATHAGCNTSNGQITVEATGEGTLMYMLNDGSFQSSNVFPNLASGSYKVVVKDASNCETSAEEQVLNGTSYEQQVKSIIQTNCAVSGCHDGSNGPSRNWTVFANVKSNAGSIKSTTQAGTMPPAGSGQSLTETEKNLIACWVDDGALNN